MANEDQGAYLESRSIIVLCQIKILITQHVIASLNLLKLLPTFVNN